MFIVIDGIDGSGKTTQCKLVADYLLAKGVKTLMIREPGCTPVGEKIREFLLFDDMDVKTETLLFMAARAELMKRTVTPWLELGNTVIADRFVTSTFAYQDVQPGYLMQIADFVLDGRWPTHTFILDLPVADAMERCKQKNLDKFEKRPAEFHEKVRGKMLGMKHMLPGKFVIVDASKPIDYVTGVILNGLR